MRGERSLRSAALRFAVVGLEGVGRRLPTAPGEALPAARLRLEDVGRRGSSPSAVRRAGWSFVAAAFRETAFLPPACRRRRPNSRRAVRPAPFPAASSPKVAWPVCGAGTLNRLSMRMIATTARTFGFAAVGLLAAAPLLGGPPPDPPPFYAIENVRVEVGDGTMLERATVVVENGTITAVAEDAAVPAHAWVIEGEGLTVYPGLIDAMGNLPQPRRPPGGPGAGGPPDGQRRRPDPDRQLPRGPEDRPLTTPGSGRPTTWRWTRRRSRPGARPGSPRSRRGRATGCSRGGCRWCGWALPAAIRSTRWLPPGWPRWQRFAAAAVSVPTPAR